MRFERGFAAYSFLENGWKGIRGVEVRRSLRVTGRGVGSARDAQARARRGLGRPMSSCGDTGRRVDATRAFCRPLRGLHGIFVDFSQGSRPLRRTSPWANFFAPYGSGFDRGFAAYFISQNSC
jgi:hypothetical protein